MHNHPLVGSIKVQQPKTHSWAFQVASLPSLVVKITCFFPSTRFSGVYINKMHGFSLQSVPSSSSLHQLLSPNQCSTFSSSVFLFPYLFHLHVESREGLRMDVSYWLPFFSTKDFFPMCVSSRNRFTLLWGLIGELSDSQVKSKCIHTFVLLNFIQIDQIHGLSSFPFINVKIILKHDKILIK